MKALLICFSQTGNTHKIAERIRTGINAAGASCGLKPRPKSRRPCRPTTTWWAWGPRSFITADWRRMVAMAPANYARYKQELDKAKARGEFHWRVDPQTIVFDDPLYKQREREIKANK